MNIQNSWETKEALREERFDQITDWICLAILGAIVIVISMGLIIRFLA
jgi:hypothetical protein